MKRSLLALLACFAFSAQSATLSNAQRANLLTAIRAAPAIDAPRVAGDTISLCAALNAPAAGPVLAWNNSTPAQTSDEAANYTSYDSLAAGKRDSWAVFLRNSRDFSKAKIRNWVVDVWGSAVASSVSEAILLAGTVSATWAQNALGGTVRTTGTVSALDRGYIAQTDSDDCSWLVNQP